MDCKSARLLLEMSGCHPDELDAEEAAALQQHLQQCPLCEQIADNERRADAALRQAMQAVPIPEGLQVRLLARLDVQRDAFYRRLLVRAAALAAAVLLVVGVGWYATGPWRQTTLDLEQLHELANRRNGGSLVANVEEDVNAWLQRVGGEQLVAPRDFDYNKLATYQLSTLLDRTQVPMLLFISTRDNGEPCFAEVYVLSETQFNFASLNRSQDLVSGLGPKVEILASPTTDSIRYLVIFTGADLRPFEAVHIGV
jgi:hypothetical protein